MGGVVLRMKHIKIDNRQGMDGPVCNGRTPMSRYTIQGALHKTGPWNKGLMPAGNRPIKNKCVGSYFVRNI